MDSMKVGALDFQPFPKWDSGCDELERRVNNGRPEWEKCAD